MTLGDIYNKSNPSFKINKIRCILKNVDYKIFTTSLYCCKLNLRGSKNKIKKNLKLPKVLRSNTFDVERTDR